MPRGRPKGSTNKFTGTMKTAFEKAYQSIGGDEKLASWAKDNLTDFYKICARMIPQAIQGDFTHTHQGLAEELPDDELARIATASRDGAAAKKGSQEEPTKVH